MQEGKFELYGIAAGVRGHSLTHTPAVSHMEWMLFMQKDFLYSFIRVCASLGENESLLSQQQKQGFTEPCRKTEL